MPRNVPKEPKLQETAVAEQVLPVSAGEKAAMVKEQWIKQGEEIFGQQLASAASAVENPPGLALPGKHESRDRGVGATTLLAKLGWDAACAADRRVRAARAVPSGAACWLIITAGGGAGVLLPPESHALEHFG